MKSKKVLTCLLHWQKPKKYGIHLQAKLAKLAYIIETCKWELLSN